MMTMTKNGSALANKFMAQARRNGAHPAGGQRRVHAFLTRNKAVNVDESVLSSQDSDIPAAAESVPYVEEMPAAIEPVAEIAALEPIGEIAAMEPIGEIAAMEPVAESQGRKVTLEDLLRFEDDFRPPTLEDLLNFNCDHFSI